MSARRARCRAAGLVLIAMPAALAVAYDWLQFNGNSQHSGNNTQETILGPSNVANLVTLFQITLPSTADGAPVYLSNVVTSGGTRDVVFVTTKAGHILALDASNGATIWSHQKGPGTCKINNGSAACYTTSSPAVDPDRQFVYSYGLDGYVHKYQVGDGAEILTGGWPELATTKGFDEKESSALAIATSAGTSYLYVANGGYPGDNGDYQGHITAINLSNGAQKVFNALCSDQTVHFLHSPNLPDCPSVQTAIWARPGVIYDAGTGRIFMATGNGDYDPANRYWGDSVFALNPDGTGSGGNPLDTYTPTNFQQLQNADADLGSTAPAILPVPAASNVQHLAVQGGKDAKLRLINLADLSGQGGPGHTGGEVGSIINVPQGGQVLSQPAVWINPSDQSTWVFVANGSGISGLRLSIDGSGNPSLSTQWQKATGGFSPIVANGVLYYAGSGIIRAFTPTTGSQLWSSNQIGGIHWESPVVANGVLYISDESSHLTAFSLPFAVTSVAPSFGPVGGGTLVTIAGYGFQTGATVSFGGDAAASVDVLRPGEILATTPGHSAGAVDVVVTNPDASMATLPGGFTYGATGFFSVTPCRAIDTRYTNGPYGGPALAAGAERTFTLAGQCSVPSGARAVSVNVTITQAVAAGDLRLYPAGTDRPLGSTINYAATQTRANNAVISLDASGRFTVYCEQTSGTVQFIVDVDGYFQ
jgi:IPT/TIG domain/PQQ enzyme repeat/PQQ-like domain